jgi:hypothetical protein
MDTKLIRPGLLVSLKSTLRGGVQYQKQTIQPETAVGASTVASWQTTREIADAEEHARAVVARGKARAVVTRVCCPSSFGLLCPISLETEFAAAITEAQAIADAHNSTARHTRVDVYVIAGRIADNDEMAARAIATEIRDLIRDMERGIRAADPAAIREAADKARAVAGMLSDETERKVTAAIKEARSAARAIVARVGKAGEVAADVVREIRTEALQSARFAVLDLAGGDAEIVPQSDAPARVVDLMPESAPESVPTVYGLQPAAPAAAPAAPILPTPSFEME